MVIFILISLVLAAGCTTQAPAPTKIINTPATITETPRMNITTPVVTSPTKIIILPTPTPVPTETGFKGYVLPDKTDRKSVV